MIRITLSSLLMLTILISCNRPTENGTDKEEQDTVQSFNPKLEMIWETDTVLTTSESVLFDPKGDVLYVSNISGQPTAKDGVGFISKLDKTGKIKTLKWVTGLNAPKGMTLLNGKLYVTDIDRLVEIDINDSTSVKSYPVKNAMFLNDVANDGEKVYFSDMNTGTIHIFENNTLSTFADSVTNINGLAINTHGELLGLDESGLKKLSMEDSEPEMINEVVTGGDGLVIIDDDTYVASRWQGEIYVIKEGKEYLLLDTKDKNSNTADIGYIPEEQIVLVPTFFANKVVAYKLTY